MFNIVERRRWYFLFSALIIVPGILIMIYSTATTGAPFRLDIDFVGGSNYSFQYTDDGPTEGDIRAVFRDLTGDEVVVQQRGEPSEHKWSVTAGFYDNDTQEAIREALAELGPLDEDSFNFESVSATIGHEVTQAAIAAVLVATIVITGFIVVAFRQVPNAFRYGVCAIAAMLHDILVVMGVMSLMGIVLGWKVDALFLTAVLTVVGFSVQDSIVLFDRIRENIPRYLGEPYEMIVNRSIWETIHRSLATQLNAFFIMIAILLFGGDTIKQFIFIFFVGLLSGTYSSIFIAVPLLVSWEKGEIPFLKGSGTLHQDAEFAEA